MKLTPRDPLPKGIWEGQTAWILGGGPSLKAFEFSLLEEHRVIGLNGAFALGPSVCDCIFFGDTKFYARYAEDLRKFDGLIYGIPPILEKPEEKNIKFLSRMPQGMWPDAIGWNANTGAAAINLAIIMGVKKIYLLGFDMHLSPKRETNWHELGLDVGKEDVYQRFISGFANVKRDWKAKFPDVEIFNVNDDSDLKVFPMLSVKEGLRILAGEGHGDSNNGCSRS